MAKFKKLKVTLNLLNYVLDFRALFEDEIVNVCKESCVRLCVISSDWKNIEKSQ